MHCCPRPSASGNSASGHPQHLVGDSFDCCTERYEKVVKCSGCGGDSFYIFEYGDVLALYVYFSALPNMIRYVFQYQII